MIEEYTADGIELLTAQEAIRRRPTMYLGEPLAAPTVLGLLVQQVLCWALDEAARGTANELRVTLHADGSIAVADDGAGMPVVPDPVSGRPMAERFMTVLAACRAAKHHAAVAEKYCHKGMVVTNALSAWCTLEVARDGQRWCQRYELGVAVTELERVGTTRATGTEIRFRPDPMFFADRAIDEADLERRLRAAAADVPGTRVVCIDARGFGAPTTALDVQVPCTAQS